MGQLAISPSPLTVFCSSFSPSILFLDWTKKEKAFLLVLTVNVSPLVASPWSPPQGPPPGPLSHAAVGSTNQKRSRVHVYFVRAVPSVASV